jgi:diguanylate cyclase (GGDEF)-like protein
MITSHASLDNAVATLKAGAFESIFKPFQDLDLITEVVNRGMDRIDMLRQNRKLVENLEQNNKSIERDNKKLKELVIRDGLTGLFNYRHFMEILDREVARAVRYERSFCLLMLDVDHFKNYNDTHGHPAGDEVLKTLADIVTTRLRAVDFSARYGGEEFVVLLPETDLAGAGTVADDIRVQVENYPFEGRETQPLGNVTISLGVAELLDWSEEPASLLKRADDALYRAKSEGRNRVVCADKPG